MDHGYGAIIPCRWFFESERIPADVLIMIMGPTGTSAPPLGPAIEAFEREFGHRPTLAAAAPGRVNLMGEHTDYNDGHVLPMAIDPAVLALATPAVSDRSSLWAMDLDTTVMVQLGGRPKRRSQKFANYIVGVAAQFQRRGYEWPELDLAITGTIPVGAGLGSSGALGVATCLILEQAADMPAGTLDHETRARLCQQAERDFADTPCGVMDMLIASAAEKGAAMLIDCRSGQYHPVPMPPSDEAIAVIVDTGVRHDLASGEYAERRQTCEAVAGKLGVPALRDASREMIQHADLTDLERKRARHVIDENRRTLLAASLLRDGELERFGELMFESHDSLRELFEVSCPELDVVVESAATLCDEGVVHGARMTGGGFGGSAVVLCPADAVDEVADFISGRFNKQFGRRPRVIPASAAAGAQYVPLPSTET